jgi:integrase
MEIPELMDVVRAWDEIVRRDLPGTAMWYANLSVHPTEPKRVVAVTVQSRNRARGLRIELGWLCAQAGIPYLSPHHFRHGFVVHAEAHATSMADRKAISQTLMHSDLSITDGVYGRLKIDDVRDRVGRLGGSGVNGDREDVIARLEAILAELRGQV